MLTSKLAPSSAVVVASSSRSGSTWLADMLSSALRLQQVFEPLHPKHNATVRQLTGFDQSKDHVSSFYLRATGTYPAWDRLLEAVLAGQARNTWTDTVPAVQAARGYLIKMIRANLMLGYLHDRFQPKLIYLMRHPCAVVNSRLKMGWTANARSLLKQEDLVQDYLHPWVAEIEREEHIVGSHALWWAVENLVTQSELSTRSHYRIFYEHLVIDPLQETNRVAKHCGQETSEISQTVIRSLSRTSHRVGIDALLVPLVSWKDDLSNEDQLRILDWVDRLGVSWYGLDTWPNGVSGPSALLNNKPGGAR